MSNIIYLKRNGRLDTSGKFCYDVMYEIDEDIRAFEFKIKSNDDDNPGSLHSIVSSGSCESEHFLRNLNIDNGKVVGLENPFGASSGCIPASSHDNPCILIQLLFTKEFEKKPSITGIHISDPDKSPIPTTHGGSIIKLPISVVKLPSGALTKTYQRDNTVIQNLFTTLNEAKQWADDHDLTISDWDISSSADYVDFSTAGNYTVTYSMSDVFGVVTTETVYITVEDTVAPTLSNVTLLSSQSGNSSWAREGDRVTLSF